MQSQDEENSNSKAIKSSGSEDLNGKGRDPSCGFLSRLKDALQGGSLFFKLTLGVTLIVALAVFYVGYTLFAPVSFTDNEALRVDVQVNRGDTMRSVARKVSQSGIEVNETYLSILLRLYGDPAKIHAGRYRFERGITLTEIVDQLTTGLVAQGRIRILEGTTFRELRNLVDNHVDLKHTTAALAEEEILKKLGANESKAEGLFSPDTYHFKTGVTDFSFYKQAYEKQKEVLEREWNSRAPGLKLKTPYEALILASIIEKETGIRTDRHLVSSVFHNRLRIWMPLQTDPTVIYGLGDDFKGRLRKKDLTKPTPYNSYLNYGLPPTPIAMPSADSIQAALHPAATKYLYFVAKGDGTTEFSVTLEAHNRAVAKYQKKRKSKN